MEYAPKSGRTPAKHCMNSLSKRRGKQNCCELVCSIIRQMRQPEADDMHPRPVDHEQLIQ
jgi:hypothetical protein